MKESDDDVRDLHAGVIDIKLRFGSLAVRLQNSDERVAQNGVADVTDVRGFVRIDRSVLDHALRRDFR